LFKPSEQKGFVQRLERFELFERLERAHAKRRVLLMSQTDWAKLYAAMDKRIILKYQQLPKGEQIGKRPEKERKPA